MKTTTSSPPPRPHALLFPFPSQGHVRPFMQLAQYLSGVYGFKITFANTSHIHKRLGTSVDTGIENNIHFVDIEDCIMDECYTTKEFKRLYSELKALEPILQRCVENVRKLDPVPITCIISDYNFIQAHYTALRVGIPSVGFSTQSAMSLIMKFHSQKMIHEGLLPLPTATEDSEIVRSLQEIINSSEENKVACACMVTCVPGLHPIRVGELHTLLLTTNLSSSLFQLFTNHQSESLHSQVWSLVNTFDELEASVLLPFQRDAGVNLITVGPLVVAPTTPDRTLDNDVEERDTCSLWPEEVDCMGWLNKQRPKSVIYVSFGSTTVMTPSMLEEFILGLEDSQVPFLLVVRPNLVAGVKQGIPFGFEERTKDRALIVSWVPQLKVLGHPATVGFVTHCGWNSLMESLSMGVPMLGCPYFADQAMNNRFLVEVWKMGLEFERRADLSIERHEVARKVRMLASQDSELGIAARKWKDVVRRAVEHGGSSQNNMTTFAADMHKRAHMTSSSTTENL